MSKDSLEYITLTKATATLTKIVKNNITLLCVELVSRGLITPDQQKKLRDPNHDVVERADDLVQLITDKVELNTKNYYDFIEILAEDRYTYGDVLYILEFPVEPESKDFASANKRSTASGTHDLSSLFGVCIIF